MINLIEIVVIELIFIIKNEYVRDIGNRGTININKTPSLARTNPHPKVDMEVLPSSF